MKKNISRNPLWPDWYNGKKIDEVQFGRAFLEQWPLKCVNGTLYTLDGPVEDERRDRPGGQRNEGGFHPQSLRRGGRCQSHRRRAGG